MLDAGFTIAGAPAASVGASFSSMPHTGKLKALICTAAPSLGCVDVLADKGAVS